MTPSLSDFDLLAEAYPVHARRAAPAHRPPKRESPRFSNKRGKTCFVNGAHRRGQKRTAL